MNIVRKRKHRRLIDGNDDHGQGGEGLHGSFHRSNTGTGKGKRKKGNKEKEKEKFLKKFALALPKFLLIHSNTLLFFYRN